ncbi:MAG: response regulator [Methylococcales bacterium]
MNLIKIKLFFSTLREGVFRKTTSENENRLQTLLDNISDAIITIDSKGIMLTVNNAVEHLFGYRPSELIGENINILMTEPYSSMHNSYLLNYQKTGQAHVIGKTREVEGLRKNGEVFEVELWVHVLQFNKQTQYMGIIRDISERKHLDTLKTEFISTVSHELRTPLTSIRGSLGMLKSGVLGEVSKKAERMIELAHNNTERLINLVNDILDVEKIQAGKMLLNFEDVNITSLVKQSIEANETYAKSCNVTLKLSAGERDYHVYADSQRLHQVMANLISNAAKFSPEKGVVCIEISKKNNFICVSITDQGLGIPEQYRHKIFQKFSQVDSSDTRQKGGTGLGLNITKAIIDHHGGHINYTTEEGKGSTFFFELLEYQGENEQSSDIRQPSDSVIPPHKKNGQHILVLEDEPDIAKLLSLLLEQQNFNVSTCSNTTEARKLLETTQFDAITVDIRLPGQDGLSFVQEIRSKESNFCLPIIIISAEAEIHKNKSSAALRIVDWIDKPIDTERLKKSLHYALKKSTHSLANILHVEDNEDLIEMMSGLLANKAQLSQASTLQSAKGQIKSTHFDLIILDVGLPDGNGLDLIPLINQQAPLVPIIIFSAQSVERDIIKQVDAALIKSKVSNEELVGTIKKLISDSGL